MSIFDHNPLWWTWKPSGDISVSAIMPGKRIPTALTLMGMATLPIIIPTVNNIIGGSIEDKALGMLPDEARDIVGGVLELAKADLKKLNEK